MIEDTIRQFRDGRFTNILLPNWLEKAGQLTSEQKLDWHHAVTRVLEAEHQGLTVEPTGPVGIAINFWRSSKFGTYVEIDSELDFIEQVLIPDLADWLPFMSAYLTPMLAAAAQAATAAQLERVANTLISFGRHEHGQHIDRWTGRSQVDEARDTAYLARVAAQVNG
jgi:hypothetical protein